MQNIELYLRNCEKRRYYKIFLGKDLLGDWILSKAWGSMDNARGRIVHLTIKNYEIGISKITKLKNDKFSRGYSEKLK